MTQRQPEEIAVKLYDSRLAPNPRRVRIFLAEKGCAMPELVPVDIMKGEHKAPEYRAKSPLALLPALELDDGTVITETVAICRYFEELDPDTNNLMGRTPLEKAQIEMWQRRMEFQVFLSIAMAFRHLHPAMAQLEDQCKPWGEINQVRAGKALAWLDGELATRAFVAGDRYTIADITAMVALHFTRIAPVEVPDSLTNLHRWLGEVSARPSAKA